MATGSEFATWDMAKAMYETIMATIGPVEASTTASAAHAKGSYFVMGGVLYQATAAIAVGDTIATTGSGANCVTVPGGLCASIATLESYATASYTPAQLSAIAASGVADRYFSVGDIITIPWTDRSGETDVEYQYPFIVVDITSAEDEDGNIHQKAIWLQAMYATPTAIRYKIPDKLEVDLSTEPNALEGWYYVGNTGSTYTDLELSPGDPIPTTYTTVYKTTSPNSPAGVVQSGRSSWRTSDARQWLNSTAAKGDGWWTSKYDGSVAPSDTYRLIPGFLGGFGTDWRAIFKTVKITIGSVNIYDKVFLPSRTQMRGSSSSSPSNWPYWTSVVNPPTDDAVDARIFTKLDEQSGSSVAVATLSQNGHDRLFRASETGSINSSVQRLPSYTFNYTPCLCLF